MDKKIIFTTGGTGGHILPAIHLMSHFFEKKYETIIVTDHRGEKFLKNNLKFKSYILPAATPTNKNFFNKIISFLLIFYSIFKSIIILKKEKPDLVFGFGGYVSFPISFASKFFNIPLVIYESNIILGRANKILAPFSKKIFLSKKKIENYSKKYEFKTHYVGSIVDKKIINYKIIKKNENNSFSVLVLGGSQGAEIFGDIIPPVIDKLKSQGFNIKIAHQCIPTQRKKILDFYEKNNIENYVFEFNKDIVELLASSDLAITRSGASTTAELVHMLTPFIAVPLPNSVDNHQFLNAKYYENEGCCWVLEQKYFNKENLHDLVVESIKNKNKLENIKQNMKKNNYTNAYKELEDKINNLF
jgi:UDP-N-acetylglucosamine--N-acetylmuramyl-(pentapeptide) pyrophosphoryl-undecaprenol N-acetylglucosamine transferase